MLSPPGVILQGKEPDAAPRQTDLHYTGNASTCPRGSRSGDWVVFEEPSIARASKFCLGNTQGADNKPWPSK